MGLGLPRLLLYFEEYVESKPPPPAARSGLFLLLVRALLRPIAVAGLPSSRPFPMGWRPDFMPAVAEENLLASLSIMLAWSRLPAGALLGRFRKLSERSLGRLEASWKALAAVLRPPGVLLEPS